MIDVPNAAPTAPDELRRLFLNSVNFVKGDIQEHLCVMRDTAVGMRHITEFGVGCGHSTLAWLLVQPDKLVLYDRGEQACLPTLFSVRGKTEVVFHRASTEREEEMGEVEETDLLFIDTYHSYAQLNTELTRYGDKARRFIVMHDTFTFGVQGEDGSRPGLWQAVLDFQIPRPYWQFHGHWHNCNGLTILQRKQ